MLINVRCCLWHDPSYVIHLQRRNLRDHLTRTSLYSYILYRSSHGLLVRIMTTYSEPKTLSMHIQALICKWILVRGSWCSGSTFMDADVAIFMRPRCRPINPSTCLQLSYYYYASIVKIYISVMPCSFKEPTLTAQLDVRGRKEDISDTYFHHSNIDCVHYVPLVTSHGALRRFFPGQCKDAFTSSRIIENIM